MCVDYYLLSSFTEKETMMLHKSLYLILGNLLRYKTAVYETDGLVGQFTCKGRGG